MATQKWIVSNEAVNGRRIRIRTELLANGYTECLASEGRSADYSWIAANNKTVGVQSKSSTDFMMSYVSGLLQRELEELCAYNDISILLLENFPYVDRLTGNAKNHYGTILQGNRAISYVSFVHAFANTIANAPRIFPIISSDMAFTIQWLSEIGPAYFDDPKQGEGWNKAEIVPRRKDKALQLLTGFDSLGVGRAKSLLHEFHTVDGVLTALRSGLLMKIPGIGKTTVKKMIDQLNLRYEEEE